MAADVEACLSTGITGNKSQPARGPTGNNKTSYVCIVLNVPYRYVGSASQSNHSFRVRQ